MNYMLEEIEDKVLEELRNDPKLSGCVKSITAGEVGVSMKLFPFITISNVHITIEPRSTARDVYSFTIDLLVGTSNLTPGLAYRSCGTKREGIVNLCRDIENAIVGKRFGGAFSVPVDTAKVKPGDKMSGAGTLWLGTVSFIGKKFVLRNRI